jgi:hypothetical protein
VTSAAARPTSGARSILAVGATVALLGIALSAGGSPEFGSWVTITGLLLLLVGLHRFGRSGADEPVPRDRPRKKKRKRKRKPHAEAAATPTEPMPDPDAS